MVDLLSDLRHRFVCNDHLILHLVTVMRDMPVLAVFIMNILMIYRVRCCLSSDLMNTFLLQLNNLRLRKRNNRKKHEIKTVSKSAVENNERCCGSGKNKKNMVKRFSRLMEEIKIGKILILNSTTFLLFTVPHSVDLTIWLAIDDKEGGDQVNRINNS